LTKGFERDVESGQHAIGFDEKHALRPHIGRHRRFGGEIAGADVLGERTTHEIGVERRG